MRFRVLLVLAMLLAAVAASAQPSNTYIINPTKVQFTPSPDHDLVLPDGTEMVTRYEVRVMAAGALEPVSVLDIGKPPIATGDILRDVSGLIGALPFDPRIQYTVIVAAIGPTGEGPSEPSNPFGHVGRPGAAANVRTSR